MSNLSRFDEGWNAAISAVQEHLRADLELLNEPRFAEIVEMVRAQREIAAEELHSLRKHAKAKGAGA